MQKSDLPRFFAVIPDFSPIFPLPRVARFQQRTIVNGRTKVLALFESANRLVKLFFHRAKKEVRGAGFEQ